MDAELKTYLDGKFSDARINLDALRAEIDARFGELRTENDAKFGELRADIDARFGELRAEIDVRFNEERIERRAEIEKTETNLLRAFHNWARPMEIRVRESDTKVAGFDLRLAFIEERDSELERRIAS